MARRAYPREAYSLPSQNQPPPTNAFNPSSPFANQPTSNQPTPGLVNPESAPRPVATAPQFFNPQGFSGGGQMPNPNPNPPSAVPPTSSHQVFGAVPTAPITYATPTTSAPPALEPLPQAQFMPINTQMNPTPPRPAPAPVPTGPRHAPPPTLASADASPPVPTNPTAPTPAPGPTSQTTTIGKRPVAYPENPSNFGQSSTSNFGSPMGGQSPARPSGPTGVNSPLPEPKPEWTAPKEFVRCTLETWPNSNDILDKTGLPFGISFHPLANTNKPVPVVNFGECHIIRCKTCRAYINPYVSFVEGGKRWRCNLCYFLNDVPREYFSIVGNNGFRYDHNERLELNNSVVEFVASSEFMNRPPQPPIYFFMIDVSYTAVISGMVRAVCNAIYQAIENNLSKNKRTKVGFMTYDSSIHYYNLRSSLASPQMLVVPEIDNPFSPHPDDLLVNLEESRHLIDKLLLNLLPNLFQQGQENESAFGSALRGAYSVVHSQGGKVVVFQSVLPSIGIGKLPVRETTPDPTGRQLMQPGEQYYKNVALEFAKVQVCVDLFFCTPKFIDIATIGCLAKYTSGEINYYHLSQYADNEVSRLQNDVYRTLTRNTGFEALMRVRCTSGIAIDSHHGSYFLRGQDLFNLPNVDCDKAYSMKLKISDAKAFCSEKNLARDGRYYATVQAGLLYTTSQGERRIRIITKCCPITNQISDLYRDVDQQAATNLICNLALSKAVDEGLAKAIVAVKNACAHTLAQYVGASGPSQAPGSLSLPNTLLNFPLYCLAIIKNLMFRSGVGIDERMAAIRKFETLPVDFAHLALYPSLYNISNLPPEAGLATEPFVMPPALELSIEKLDQRSVFLLDNGQSFMLWVGSQTDPTVLRNLFNINSLTEVDASNSQLQLIRLENEHSQRVCNVVDNLRRGRSGYTWMYCYKEKDPTERKFFSQLVHDRFPDSNSYREFVVELKNIVTQRRGR